MSKIDAIGRVAVLVHDAVVVHERVASSRLSNRALSVARHVVRPPRLAMQEEQARFMHGIRLVEVIPIGAHNHRVNVRVSTNRKGLL